MKILERWRARSAKKAGNALPSTVAAANALQDKNYELALRLYTELIAQNGDDAELHYKRANALNGAARWEDALSGYDAAIALEPAHSRAYCNRGAVLEQMGRWEEALASYDRAIALDPEDFLAYYNRSSALKELKRFGEALAGYEHAIRLKDKYAPAFVNRGNVLQRLRLYEAAIESYERAMQLDAEIAEAFLGRGVSLVSVRRFQEALASYDQAIVKKPDYIEAHCNRGCLLQELGQHVVALASFARALELNPRFAAALQGRGFSLLRLERYEEAISSFEEAMAIEPDRKYLIGMAAYARMQVCDWTNWTRQAEKLSDGLRSKSPVSVPHPILALFDSPALHRSVAEIWAENECPKNDLLGTVLQEVHTGKIRIGYFSSDFCEHAVSFVAAELFEMHDRTRFEITAFAFGPRPNDEMRVRLQKTFDRFIDVRDKSDVEVARLARSLGIDIAVDLGGYTEYSRTGIFALRAAAVQVNFLGYPGTMGVDYMDYLIADRVLVPEALKGHYAEKLVYLPHSFMPSDSTRSISAGEIRREQFGLPRTGFVFCCFNNSYKITPPVFASWMRILSRVDGSVIWLGQNNGATARNLVREAARLGVDEKRLIFASRTRSISDHLARLGAADLFLDTLPYNAHATANDALWSGLPVISRCGESFPARVAGSLLTAIGLSELVTSTETQYEDLAVRIATDPQLLATIKDRLKRNRASAPLFNTQSFTNYLETAYVKILERQRAGFPPDHIYVDL